MEEALDLSSDRILNDEIQQLPNFDDVSMDMGLLQQNGNNLQTDMTQCYEM